jgi:hypothetical protein
MNFDEIVQRNADTMRILKAGLRGQDTETVDAEYSRIAEQYGPEFAETIVFQTITKLMDTEDFSFFDADGNPLPLLNHDLPDV